MADKDRNQYEIAPNIGALPFRYLLVGAALGYLAVIYLDEIKSGWTYRHVPGPILYFAQVAGLFTHGKNYDIDYRAEGWDCESKKFREIDVRPYFPIHADNKENRFHRAMHFYRRNGKVMLELDKYITNGFPGRIGGIRLLSIRSPIPSLGERVVRYERKPLDEHPPQHRKYWYASAAEKMMEQRCRDYS